MSRTRRTIIMPLYDYIALHGEMTTTLAAHGTPVDGDHINAAVQDAVDFDGQDRLKLVLYPQPNIELHSNAVAENESEEDALLTLRNKGLVKVHIYNDGDDTVVDVI